MEKIRISDSAQILFIKNGRFKTTRITVHFYLPLEYEYFSETAMLPFFLTSCCGEYPTPALLSQRLNDLYGALLSGTTEKIGDNRRVGFTVSALNDRFSIDGSKPMDSAAKLLCNVIFAPAMENDEFKDVDFDREKRLFCELVLSEKNDKRQYARTRLEGHLFENSPYGLPDLGNIEGAEAITKKGLFEAWQNLLRRAKICVNVVGEALPQGFVEEFTERLSAVNRQAAETNKNQPLKEAELRFVKEYEDITQGKLCIGLSTPNADDPKKRAVLTMVSDLLGGGTYSKLFTVVREKLHLCYYCASRLDRAKCTMIIDSGVDVSNAEKAQREILNQLELLKAGDFSETDMESSRKSLCNAVRTAEDAASVMDRWYASRFLDETVISPEDYRNLINSVKREEIIETAKGIKPHTVYFMLPKENSDEN